MNNEDIKVGKKYNLELLCILNKEKVIVFKTPSGDHMPLRNCDLECISPENVTKNTETAPKYDPCRKFRKGDIVEPSQVKGRWMSVTWAERSGIHYTVTEDEDKDGIMTIVKDPDCNLPSIASAVFFKLVTPVEELEPYSVGESTDYFSVDAKDGNEISCYWKDSHPNAKAGAEAERDRLNAEWRKEQK